MSVRTRSVRWSAALMAATLSAVAVPAAWSQAARVAQVEVEGNQRINKESILAIISTKPNNELSLPRLDLDVNAIRTMGWFKAVASPPRIEDTPAGKKVTFVVTEWPVVQKIVFSGNTVIDEPTLRAALRTKEGQVFNTPMLEDDLSKIPLLYREKGFAASIAPTVGENFEQTGILKIPIQEAVVGAVNVKGLRKTKPYVVLRELTMKPGQPYNINALQRDYRALERLDIFETQGQNQNDNLQPLTETTADGKVNITWQGKEKRTGQVSVGLGYSARERLVGRAELSESNFRGRGQAVNLQYEVGGFSGRNSIELGFFEPWLDHKHTSLSVNLYDKLIYRFSTRFQGTTPDSSERYNERRKGGAVTVSRPLADTFRLSLGFRHDDVQTDNLLSVVNFPTQNGTVSSGTVRGIQDTRDYATNPTGGWYRQGSVEIGGTDVSETTRAADETTSNRDLSSIFGKYTIDFRRYLALKPHKKTNPGERQRERIPVLAARVMGGVSSGELPFFEQFFLGGADTIRGYVEDRFWGERMLLFSTELRMPVSSNLIGVLFADYGDAWNPQSGLNIEGFEQSSGFRGQYGVGLGIRVTTPLGPIRLDYGIGREGGHTHFSIGHSF